MSKLLDEFRAAQKAADEILTRCKAENRALTPDENAEFDAHIARARNRQDLLLQSADSQAALNSMAPPAKAAANVFVKTALDRITKVGDAFGEKAFNVSGSVSVPAEFGGIVAEPTAARFVSDLVEVVQAPGAAEYTFLRQTARTNNAAPVALGALKPTSVYGLERATSPVTTIAHLTDPIARQYLEDEASLEQFIRSEMLLGLKQAVDAQVVEGDGIAPNLLGIMNTSGVWAQAYSTSPLATTRQALTKLQAAGVVDDTTANSVAFVMHPNDWAAIELATTTAGDYLVGGPVESATRRLWGVRVVVSTSVDPGWAILGDFAAAKLVMNGPVRIAWTEAASDDFERNLVRFRCEGRFGFAVLSPVSFVKIDVSAA